MNLTEICNFTEGLAHSKELNIVRLCTHQTYGAESTSMHWYISTITSCLLATIANIIVFVILWKKGKHRTIFDLTVWSLVITNIIVAFVYLMSIAIAMLTEEKASNLIQWLYFVTTFLVYYCFLSSLLHTLLLTIQRLFAVFFAFQFRQKATKTKAKIFIAIAWVISFALSEISTIMEDIFKYSVPVFSSLMLVFGVVSIACYSAIAIRIALSMKKKRFKWNKEHRVLLNAFIVTVSNIGLIIPIAIHFKNVPIAIGEIMVLVKLFVDPLCYFYLSYWLAKRDESKRRIANMRVSAIDNAEV